MEGVSGLLEADGVSELLDPIGVMRWVGVSWVGDDGVSIYGVGG